MKSYPCAHCPETFTNPVQLGGHVHAAHPGHKRPAPKWLRTPAPQRWQRGESLKRDSDQWPGRP